MWNLPANLLLGVFAAVGIILVLLLWLIAHSHRLGIEKGASRMIGLKGRATTIVAGEGRVMVHGEYWWARSRIPIAEGENIRVVGLEGLTLDVEPCPDKAVTPRQVSAVEPREFLEL
jgi:membrane-bound serine protease (ClpP class)